MKKRFLINFAALAVIGVGGTSTLFAEEATRPQACCTTVFTDAKCCGDFCKSGWFNCSAGTRAT